jgi:hypothetical protein
MDDSSYTQAPPKSAPRASAPDTGKRASGSGFDDMDDDIPF